MAERAPVPTSIPEAVAAVRRELLRRPPTFFTEAGQGDAGPVGTGPAGGAEGSEASAEASGAQPADSHAAPCFRPPAGTGAIVYARAPHAPKALWSAMGDAVVAAERRPCPQNDNVDIPGARWISLRLDGAGFSKFTRMLRSRGVFGRGYDSEFAEIMRFCARELLNHVQGRCAYTQSDEITVLVCVHAHVSMRLLRRWSAFGVCVCGHGACVSV
jgi:hypothetical protein